MKRIAVIPGDGIGIDVTRESLRVLNRINEVFGSSWNSSNSTGERRNIFAKASPFLPAPSKCFERFRCDFIWRDR